jgi:hypothetical protein
MLTTIQIHTKSKSSPNVPLTSGGLSGPTMWTSLPGVTEGLGAAESPDPLSCP